MSIKISNIASAYDVYGASKASPVRMTRAQEKKDMVALSEHAKDYQTAARALKNVPDIRADLVGEIQSKIESGSYNVSISDLADKMLQGF